MISSVTSWRDLEREMEFYARMKRQAATRPRGRRQASIVVAGQASSVPTPSGPSAPVLDDSSIGASSRSSSRATSSNASDPPSLLSDNDDNKSEEDEGYDTDECEQQLDQIMSGKVPKKRTNEKKRNGKAIPWKDQCNPRCVELLIHYNKDPSSAPPPTDEALRFQAKYVSILARLKQEYPQDQPQAQPNDVLREEEEKKHKAKFGADSTRVLYEPNPPPNRDVDKIQRALPVFGVLDAYVKSSDQYGGQNAKTAGSTSSNPLNSHSLLKLGNFPGHRFEAAMEEQGDVVVSTNEKGRFNEPYHRTGSSANRTLSLVEGVEDPLDITCESAEGIDQNQATNRTFWSDSHLVCLPNKSSGYPATQDEGFRDISAELVVEHLIVFGTDDAQIIPNGKEAFIFVVDKVAPLLATHGMLRHLRVFSELLAMSSSDPRSAEIRHLTVYGQGFALKEECRRWLIAVAKAHKYEKAVAALQGPDYEGIVSFICTVIVKFAEP